MRGTPVSVDEPAPELGIIPAYAGNTKLLCLIFLFHAFPPLRCAARLLAPCGAVLDMKKVTRAGALVQLADGAGFEPAEPCGAHPVSNQAR